MSARGCILAAVLTVAAACPADQPPHPKAPASDLPVTFARSGEAASADVAGGRAKSATLAAFGRVWTPATTVRGSVALIKVPSVRVPTAFAIVDASDASRRIGHLVAYPQRELDWDKQVRVVSAGVPKWFDQWARAAGLPVQQIDRPADLDKHKDDETSPGVRVLVLAGQAAGKGPARLFALARRHAADVLVLDAGWYGEDLRRPRPVRVGPSDIQAPGLSVLGARRWPAPLRFLRRRPAWGGLANRRTWIGGDQAPLVESLTDPRRDRRQIVLSYVPWPQQLGRRAEADETLLALLRAVGVGARLLVHPPARSVVPKPRPVLAAADKHARLGPPRGIGAGVAPLGTPLILDVRGREPAPEGLLGTLRPLPRRPGGVGPLLVLGDDPLLDRWEWLKFDRGKGASRQAGVTCLPDDQLPPGAAARIQVMQALTAMGVALGASRPLQGDPP